MKLIELTGDEGDVVYVNPEHIVTLVPAQDPAAGRDEGSRLYLVTGKGFVVNEPLEEVLELLGVRVEDGEE